MHAHAISSCSKPPSRTRLAEVNPLWHLRACKLGFNQLFSLLRHSPAKAGRDPAIWERDYTGAFSDSAGKGPDQVMVSLYPSRVPGHVRLGQRRRHHRPVLSLQLGPRWPLVQDVPGSTWGVPSVGCPDDRAHWSGVRRGPQLPRELPGLAKPWDTS